MATPQAEQTTLMGFTSSIESHLIRGKAFNKGEEYAVFFQKRGGDFSEEPNWPCCVLIWDFPFPPWQCGVTYLISLGPRFPYRNI